MNWTPRDRDLVKLTTFSLIGMQRKAVNIRITPVKEFKNGSLKVQGVTRAFRRKNEKVFEATQPAGIAEGAFIQVVEKPTPSELSNLPRTPESGAIFARQVHGA